MKTVITILSLLIIPFFAQVTLADNGEAGVVLDGCDVVSYFTKGKLLYF